MRSKSRKWAIALMVVLPLVVGLATGALAQDTGVVVSPNVLNLESFGGSVSLHTNIAFSSVESVKLTVESGESSEPVTPLYIFADSRGELVVKCSLAAIKDIVEVGEAIFTLTVEKKDGTEYVGSDTIRVISESGVSRKG